VPEVYASVQSAPQLIPAGELVTVPDPFNEIDNEKRVAPIVTVVELDAVPPVPVQLRVYVLAAVKAPVDWLPDRVADPVKPDVQEQEVALVELQVIVVEPPEGTVEAEAVIETVGTGAILTVADACLVPPPPVQLRVYVLVAVKAPVDWLPDRVVVPVKPDVQEQEVALVELQVIVVEPPEGIEV